MAWFRKTPKTPAELDQVKLELEKLREAMERHDLRANTLADTMRAQPDVSGLVGRVDAIDQSLASRNAGDVTARLDAFADQVSALDARITSVSTELANQISELGNEIDALQKRAAAEPVADEVIDGIRDAQERLANEQARYQIAFREDLARLAEQAKRPRA